MDTLDFDFQPKTYFGDNRSSVVIARLHYPESQWGEELSIFAEYSQGLIYYEVADFYSNTYTVQPEFTAEPLRLNQLIFLIETMEDETGNSENIDLMKMGVPEVTSDFYPEITKYFEDRRRDQRKAH